VAPPPELDARLEEGSITLDGILAAAQRAILSLPPPSPVPAGVVVPFTLTIRDQIGLIRRETTGGRAVTFRSLLQNARARVEIIVTLLAVLELIKRGKVNAAQDEMFGDIIIAPVPGAEIDDEEAMNGDA
jgi:chromatin segregation and condensation protein Rec8/ScpA/Scc1 (kleisin family)